MDNDNNPVPPTPVEPPAQPQTSYTPVLPPKPPRSLGKKLLLGALVLFVLAGIGFAATFLLGPKEEKMPSTQTTQTPTTRQETSTGFTDIAEAGEAKTFKANRPRVEFSHPATWTATETEDSGIRIESPELTYTKADGIPTKGNFRIYIRQGARSADSKYIGRGVAIQDSEKLMYKNPVVGQRPETNLTLFGLDGTDNFAYFFIAGNFTLKQGDTLGPDFGKEPETYIIAGGFSSKDLTDDLATNKVATTFFQQTNAYKQAIEIIKSLKLL